MASTKVGEAYRWATRWTNRVVLCCRSKTGGFWAVVAAMVVVATWLLALPLRGFDGAEAFYTGAALVFLIYGVWLQHEELKATREELRLTKDELAKQAEQTRQLADESRKQVNLAIRQAKLAALTAGAEFFMEHASGPEGAYYFGKAKGCLDLVDDLISTTVSLDKEQVDLEWHVDGIFLSLRNDEFTDAGLTKSQSNEKLRKLHEACGHAHAWIPKTDSRYQEVFKQMQFEPGEEHEIDGLNRRLQNVQEAVNRPYSPISYPSDSS